MSIIRKLANLTCVKLDRAMAQSHWAELASCSDAQFYAANREVLVYQKALLGCIGHRQSRGFVIHRMKERQINRNISRKAEGVSK
jgi:hypothetical protein